MRMCRRLTRTARAASATQRKSRILKRRSALEISRHPKEVAKKRKSQWNRWIKGQSLSSSNSYQGQRSN